MKSKKLTMLELYWYIIGTAIGSGLFVLLPIAIGYTGRSVVIVLILACLMRLVNGIYSVTMASMFPLKGGNYSQVSYLIPPLFSGVYGLIWIISSLTLAAYATSAISYSAAIIPAIAPYAKVLSVSIVAFFFALNYFGARVGARFQQTMTVILLLALGAFCAWGLPKVDFGTFVGEDFFVGGLSGFSAALAMCMWATDGVLTTAAALASEMDRPTRQVPRAMVGGLAIIGVIYSLIIIVASGVLPIETVAFQDLTLVAENIFPRGMYIVFVFAGAVMALMTSMLGSVTAFRYPFEQLADEGWLPPVFKKRTANGWPIVGMATMFVLVLIPVVFDISFDTVVSYTSFPGTFIILYVNIMCMRLPKQYPELWKRSFMSRMPIPLYHLLCGLGACGCIYMAYCYCADMSAKDVAMMILLTVGMFTYSWFFLKTRRVNPEYLQKQKDDIAAEILEYERSHQD